MKFVKFCIQTNLCFCIDRKNIKTKKILQAPKAVVQPTLQPYQNVGFYGAPPFAVPIQPFVPYGAHPKYQNVIDGKVLLQVNSLSTMKVSSIYIL